MSMGTKSRPRMLLVAAVVLAAEALALLVYTVLNVVAIATDNSYQVSNAVALIIMQLIVIAGLAWIVSGVLKLRPWTRTPAVMLQFVIGIVAIILLQAHRLEWGVPTLLLAAAGLVALLTPASVKALARPMPDETEEPRPARKAANAGTPKAGGSNARSGNPAKRSAAGKTRGPAGKPVSRRS